MLGFPKMWGAGCAAHIEVKGIEAIKRNQVVVVYPIQERGHYYE